MMLTVVLIIYLLVGLIIDIKIKFSSRSWKLYFTLLCILIFITTIDWLAIIF